MTPERLRQLADTWGADLRRWPGPERADAQALLAHDASMRDLLMRAAELDALLDTHAVAAPDARLVQAVLAGAPHDARRRPVGKAGGWRLPRGWWWSGAGLAGIGLAGSAVGAMVVAMALSAVVPASQSVAPGGTWANTVFDGGSGAEWSEE